MTAEECHARANLCAANAAVAVNEPVALEFLRMAAQWRAMATRSIFLDSGNAADGPAAISEFVTPHSRPGRPQGPGDKRPALPRT